MNNKYKISDQSANVAVNSAGKVVFSLQDYLSNTEVANAIKDLSYSGDNSDIDKSLQVVSEEIFDNQKDGRRYVPKTVVLFFDKLSPSEKENLKSSIKRMENSGVNVILIGVGGNADVKTMEEILGDGRKVFATKDKDSSEKEDINALVNAVLTGILIKKN